MSDLKPTVIGLSISMPLLATLAVGLRIHARRLKKITLGIDDYLALAALIFSIALSIIVMVSVFEGGLGGHLKFSSIDIPANPEQFITFSKTLYWIQFISIPPAGLTKLSVLFFYKKIFIGKPFQAIAWVMVGIVSIWNIIFFFANLLDCIPIELNWRSSAGVSGKCINFLDLFWAVIISDIVTDAIILTMPWQQIWKLNMSVNQKVQVGAVFMLGSFVVCAGIARCVLSAPGVSSGTSDPDYTYSRAPAVYWTVVESCVGVISSCLPTLQPILSHYSINSQASSLRRILYWRSKYSGDSITKVSSHPEGNSPSQAQLVYSGPGKSEYIGNNIGKGIPMNNLSRPTQGISVHRDFYQNNETV